MSSLLDEIFEVVAVQLGCRVITAESKMVEELGAESADLLNIVAALEDRFGIMIAEEELPELSTVDDLYRLVSERSR